MSGASSVLRTTDADARRQARTLLRGSRSAALGVVEPESGGFPFVSRCLLGFDIDGAPVILVSRLSVHTRALMLEPRCSLLTGEPGKGDPLAHPRLTTQCIAIPVTGDSADHPRIRARFLRRHPKSELYIDFPDFLFFKLVPQRASLNAGFGKAYRLTGEDLLIDSPAIRDIADIEAETLAYMAGHHPQAAAYYAVTLCGAAAGEWRFSGIDANGVDLASGDRLVRFEFAQSVPIAHGLRLMLANLYR